MSISETKERILTEAESLIQAKGFNAFSFKDIAKVIGIKTASIHYHFPSKEELGVEVISWHTDKISVVLSEIQNNHQLSLKQKIDALFDAILLLTYKNNNKMCLGGMFASDVQSLPMSIQSEIRIFFKILIHWIEGILIENEYSKRSSLLLSKLIMSQIEGALLLARLYQDQDFLDGAKKCIELLLA